MSQRVLVTGGSGFIGTNLVEHLVRTGYEVTNFDLAHPAQPDLAPWQAVDLLDAEALSRAVAEIEPRVICHLAARCDLDGSTIDDYRANTEGVQNLIDAARATESVERVVFASSQLVCTPGHIPRDEFDVSPPNAYGESKVLGEQLVRSRVGDAFSWVLVRPTSIWGPHFGPLYSAFFRTVRAGHYVHPRGRRVRKSFGYVGNAVHQFERIIAAPDEAVASRVLYLADYEPYPIYEWAQLVADEFGGRPIREVPVVALRVAAWGGDVLQRLGMAHPPLTSYRLRNMLTDTVFDLEPLRAIAGELPYTWQEGTRRTIEWMNWFNYAT